MSAVDYSKWAWPCLVREIKKCWEGDLEEEWPDTLCRLRDDTHWEKLWAVENLSYFFRDHLHAPNPVLMEMERRVGMIVKPPVSGP